MNYTTFGMYPQSKKVEGVVINRQADSRGYYLGSDNCLYAECNGDYFKIEPIRWKILSGGSEQILVTDKIIDAHRFSQYSNNYKNSEIRSWLNSDFYNLTFTDAEKVEL